MSLYPVFVHALSLHTVDILLCVLDQYIQNIRHIDLLLTKLLSVTAPYRCRCRPPGPCLENSEVVRWGYHGIPSPGHGEIILEQT